MDNGGAGGIASHGFIVIWPADSPANHSELQSSQQDAKNRLRDCSLRSDVCHVPHRQSPRHLRDARLTKLSSWPRAAETPAAAHTNKRQPAMFLKIRHSEGGQRARVMERWDQPALDQRAASGLIAAHVSGAFRTFPSMLAEKKTTLDS